jgi:hypothetical protein
MLAPEWEKPAMDKRERLGELFAGRHFDREIILLCVRWYLRFKLSLRDLVEMMAERGRLDLTFRSEIAYPLEPRTNQ